MPCRSEPVVLPAAPRLVMTVYPTLLMVRKPVPERGVEPESVKKLICPEKPLGPKPMLTLPLPGSRSTLALFSAFMTALTSMSLLAVSVSLCVLQVTASSMLTLPAVPLMPLADEIEMLLLLSSDPSAVPVMSPPLAATV